MTEAEWLSAAWDTRPLLEYLRGRVSDRKLVLFGLACLDIVLRVTDPARRKVMRDRWEDRFRRGPAWETAFSASLECYFACAGHGRPAADQVPLLRDIVGNPFRPVECEPHWRTPDVVGLARAVYEERAFERLPVLADALLDAGCADETILSHCRGPGPHARGCWVVDLLLENG